MWVMTTRVGTTAPVHACSYRPVRAREESVREGRRGVRGGGGGGEFGAHRIPISLLPLGVPFASSARLAVARCRSGPSAPSRWGHAVAHSLHVVHRAVPAGPVALMRCPLALARSLHAVPRLPRHFVAVPIALRVGGRGVGGEYFCRRAICATSPPPTFVGGWFAQLPPFVPPPGVPVCPLRRLAPGSRPAWVGGGVYLRVPRPPLSCVPCRRRASASAVRLGVEPAARRLLPPRSPFLLVVVVPVSASHPRRRVLVGLALLA